MRYEVRPEGERFRVYDSTRGAFTSGKFHRPEQAQEWIDQQLLKQARKGVGGLNPHRARLRAELITDRDYAGSNEKVIAS